MTYSIRQTEGDALELSADGDVLHKVLCFKLLRNGQFIDYFSSLNRIALWAAERDESYFDEIDAKRVPLILTRSQAFFLSMTSEFANYTQTQHRGLLEMVAYDNPNRRYGLTPELYGYPINVLEEKYKILDVKVFAREVLGVELLDSQIKHIEEDIQPFIVEDSK